MWIFMDTLDKGTNKLLLMLVCIKLCCQFRRWWSCWCCHYPCWGSCWSSGSSNLHSSESTLHNNTWGWKCPSSVQLHWLQECHLHAVKVCKNQFHHFCPCFNEEIQSVRFWRTFIVIEAIVSISIDSKLLRRFFSVAKRL